METEVTVQPPLTIRGFCQALFLKCSAKWPPGEELIATEFVSYFKIEAFPSLMRLQQLCESIGVKVVEQDLPKGIRGFNHAYGEQREIVIGTIRPETAASGSGEHTLLHEIREQIEYELRKSGHSILNDLDQEKRAEQFASNVRLLASAKAAMPVFEDILSIPKSGWAKIALGAFLVICGLAYGLSCLSLPYWEDHL